MKKNNVISEVLNNQLCIGCGMCASICPTGNLKMGWNGFGEYNPFEQGLCLENCSLCLKVCPFMRGNANEDVLGEKLFGSLPEIKHSVETGYYLNAYVGFSKNRSIAASGGITTFLLERLLLEGAVDKVVCVKPSETGDPLFEYRVIETREGILQSAGSIYYPVTLSEVVRHIIENPGKYAVTALPCFVKALRLSSEMLPILKKRIKFIFGLACGQTKSTFYTKYIASLGGVNETLKRCFFREKAIDQPAHNFAFTAEDISGKRVRIRWNEGVSEVWGARCFTPLACNFCDDIFAELADVAFMDAWLPGYRENPSGTNLLIVRNTEIKSLIEVAKNNELNVDHIPIKDVILSQAGVIRTKRRHLSYRMSQIDATKKNLPKKRIVPSRLKWNFIERQEISVLDKLQSISRDLVLEASQKGITCEDIKSRLEPYIKELKSLHRKEKYSSIPGKVFGKVVRMLKNTILTEINRNHK